MRKSLGVLRYEDTCGPAPESGIVVPRATPGDAGDDVICGDTDTMGGT